MEISYLDLFDVHRICMYTVYWYNVHGVIFLSFRDISHHTSLPPPFDENISHVPALPCSICIFSQGSRKPIGSSPSPSKTPRESCCINVKNNFTCARQAGSCFPKYGNPHVVIKKKPSVTTALRVRTLRPKRDQRPLAWVWDSFPWFGGWCCWMIFVSDICFWYLKDVVLSNPNTKHENVWDVCLGCVPIFTSLYHSLPYRHGTSWSSFRSQRPPSVRLAGKFHTCRGDWGSRLETIDVESYNWSQSSRLRPLNKFQWNKIKHSWTLPLLLYLTRYSLSSSQFIPPTHWQIHKKSLMYLLTHSLTHSLSLSHSLTHSC